VIRFGGKDHGQQFGLSVPLDGIARAIDLLRSSPVSYVEIRRGPGDLMIDFENGVRCEAFNNSCGYEGWNWSGENGDGVVAQGGGQMCVWKGGGQLVTAKPDLT
jgi:hypothetical protein